MKAFISEDDIEQAICEHLSAPEFGWTRIECDPSPDKKDDVSKTGRANASECILPKVFYNALKRLNPNVPQEYLDNIFKEFRKDYSGTDMVDTNYKFYNKIRNGIKINTRTKKGDDFEIVKLIDFDDINNNDFHCVNQMWIQGRYDYRRPDVLLFINGLPVVFIELKNSTIKMEQAYNKNLVDYRQSIPNIFAMNQICVLSNGFKTKIGAWNSDYEFFFEWLRVDDEKEKINRKLIGEEGLSIKYLMDGLFKRDRLLDYIENFIFFNNKRTKIIAMNHQFLGVNNLIYNAKHREELNHKLGVFWHTQGSGKSFSMVMFVRKIRRKFDGNFTFLIVTDREDLDTQIHKNFVRAEVIGEKEECQPKDSKQLRNFLSSNKPIVFTLIHKFKFDKTLQYPLLSDRDDIFVLVDEAHRSQYQQLGENMHKGLPNANYIAFTGTPLLGSKRLTNQWFGKYVSEYNFSQAIDDGSTVPLFYSRRVPEVALTNNWLDDDVVNIIEKENLNDKEREMLENSGSRILEVIKRDDRLEKIAKDIAHHFPRRGFLGKGMVVSVDKFTAVRMYEKVQHYWGEEKKEIVKERNLATTKEERDRLTALLDYMNKVEMAVVISEEAGEEEIFKKQGLDIKPIREKMNAITPEGHTIEDRFKDKNDSLSLVFVCAMWLTGFDVPSLSTLYLDKPMKSHTLMQAIARANRVCPGKTSGVIVDYVNVFKYMREALSEYATTDGNDYPAKDITMLIKSLDECVDECESFLLGLGVDIEKIIEESDTLDRLEMLRQAFMKIIEKDDSKTRFAALSNTLISLYEASKPEIFEIGWYNRKFPALNYLYGLSCNLIDDEKLNKAKARLADTLDQSVSSANAGSNSDYVIHEGEVIDLSKLNVDDIKKEINNSPYKQLEIDNLREYIEKVLKQMINKNKTRITFSERYRRVIDRYNAGGTENQEYYDMLVELIESLKGEQSRSSEMGLEEEELEIYDLLIKDKKLTKAEEQKVILASKNLYQKLLAEKARLMVVDWYKDEQPKQKVYDFIQVTLNKDLPQCYDKKTFDDKSKVLLTHFADMAAKGYGWAAA